MYMYVCIFLVICSAHLTLSDTSMLLPTAAVHSFLLLNNIPLYEHTIYVFGCWQVLGLFSIFGNYKQCCHYTSVYISRGAYVHWLLQGTDLEATWETHVCNFSYNNEVLSKVAAPTSMITVYEHFRNSRSQLMLGVFRT